jgi:hypothetical protein
LSILFNSRFCILALLSVLFMACHETNVKISVDENSTPTFRFTGNGELPFFIVKEIPAADWVPSAADDDKVLWKIVPTESHGRVPLGPIKYGELPDGFVQKEPSQGPPKALEEGKFYQAGGPPIAMKDGYLRFTISQGKLVRIVER